MHESKNFVLKIISCSTRIELNIFSQLRNAPQGAINLVPEKFQLVNPLCSINGSTSSPFLNTKLMARQRVGYLWAKNIFAPEKKMKITYHCNVNIKNNIFLIL